MRRFTALLGKELRQHAAIGIALVLCLGGIFLLMLLGTLMRSETVSLMTTHARFLIFLTLGGMVLGNRLIVGEYYGRTQLFVEALPMRRWEMVALKYLLGLALLLLAAGASLAISAATSLSREAIDGQFLAIVAARTASYVFCFWSFFFAMGMIGRFRIPIYLAIVLAIFAVDEMTAFRLEHFGPIAVLDPSTLPFERETLPARAVGETLALGTGLIALAFLLALINEGSVAETLARRMSQREKAMIGILFIALMLALVFFEERRDKEPYAFTEEQVVRSETWPLEVLYLLPEKRDDAELLLGQLEDDLGALATELGWRVVPAVRVAYGSSLDAGIYDRAELENNDGILVRANFVPSAGFDARDFSAHITALMLDDATRGRARFEPKAWLRDGFAHWWSLRERSADGVDPMACRDGNTTLPRALWATRSEPLTEELVAKWLRYRERHGEDLAEAVATSGLWALEALHGRDAVLRLAHAIFARESPENARELFYEWRHPLAVVFQEATEVDWSDFITEWNGWLERLRQTPECSRHLAAVPEGTGSIEIDAGTGAVRDLTYGFSFTRPPAEGALVTLLHRRLTAFDTELERRDLRRVEKLWPAGEQSASWRLPGLYSRGSRAFLALEVESEALGCPIRLLAERRVFR